MAKLEKSKALKGEDKDRALRALREENVYLAKPADVTRYVESKRRTESARTAAAASAAADSEAARRREGAAAAAERARVERERDDREAARADLERQLDVMTAERTAAQEAVEDARRLATEEAERLARQAEEAKTVALAGVRQTAEREKEAAVAAERAKAEREKAEATAAAEKSLRDRMEKEQAEAIDISERALRESMQRQKEEALAEARRVATEEAERAERSKTAALEEAEREKAEATAAAAAERTRVQRERDDREAARADLERQLATMTTAKDTAQEALAEARRVATEEVERAAAEAQAEAVEEAHQAAKSEAERLARAQAEEVAATRRAVEAQIAALQKARQTAERQNEELRAELAALSRTRGAAGAAAAAAADPYRTPRRSTSGLEGSPGSEMSTATAFSRRKEPIRMRPLPGKSEGGGASGGARSLEEMTNKELEAYIDEKSKEATGLNHARLDGGADFGDVQRAKAEIERAKKILYNRSDAGVFERLSRMSDEELKEYVRINEGVTDRGWTRLRAVKILQVRRETGAAEGTPTLAQIQEDYSLALRHNPRGYAAIHGAEIIDKMRRREPVDPEMLRIFMEDMKVTKSVLKK